MSIDRETVDHVAELARLDLSEAEREHLRDQLSALLEHINVLLEADTAQVPAQAHVLPIQNVQAEDRSRPCCPRDELLANAPAQQDGYFRVRAVLEDE
jgi:aspartyl-tRNA(Asn)/glutamyl-tRNA(Gln) amidotransferase subunit C